jgi:hypothetical protein
MRHVRYKGVQSRPRTCHPPFKNPDGGATGVVHLSGSAAHCRKTGFMLRAGCARLCRFADRPPTVKNSDRLPTDGPGVRPWRPGLPSSPDRAQKRKHQLPGLLWRGVQALPAGSRRRKMAGLAMPGREDRTASPVGSVANSLAGEGISDVRARPTQSRAVRWKPAPTRHARLLRWERKARVSRRWTKLRSARSTLGS